MSNMSIHPSGRFDGNSAMAGSKFSRREDSRFFGYTICIGSKLTETIEKNNTVTFNVMLASKVLFIYNLVLTDHCDSYWTKELTFYSTKLKKKSFTGECKHQGTGFSKT